MHFSVDKNRLLSGVLKAINAVDSNSEIEAFKSIKISIFEGGISISSTSAGIFSWASVPIDDLALFKEETIFLPAKRTLDVVAALDGKIKVKVNPSEIRLSSEGSTFNVRRLKDFDLPEKKYPNLKLEDFRGIDLEKFWEAINKATSIINPSGEQLYSQLIRIDSDFMVCTDGIAMTVVKNDFAKPLNPYSFSYNLILNGVSSAKMSNLPTEYVFHDEALHLLSEDTNVVMSSVAQKYPDYSLVRKPFIGQPDTIVIGRRVLLDALKKVIVATDKMNRLMTISLAGNTLIFTCSSSEGDSRVEIDCGGSVEESEVILNVSALLKGLKQFTGDKVYVKILACNKPVMFYEEGYEFYVNPVRPSGARS